MIVSTGRMILRYSALTSMTFFQSSMFVKITRARITSSIPEPAFSSASFIISRHLLAWAAGSPTPTVLPSEFTDAVPPTEMYGPTLTARLNPTTVSMGFPFETSTRFIASPQKRILQDVSITITLRISGPASLGPLHAFIVNLKMPHPNVFLDCRI